MSKSPEAILRANGFYFEQVYVKAAPLKRRKQVRMEFKLSIKEAFKLHVEEVTGHKPRGTIHHKLPILFGGSNHFTNLVVVEDDRIHKAVHAIIDAQTDDMDYNRGRKIIIPTKRGIVWEYHNTR